MLSTICAAALAAVLPLNADDARKERVLAGLLERAGESTDPLPAPGRELFERVLTSGGFLMDSTGPFDVYVRIGDGYATEMEAFGALKAAIAGLDPLVPVMREHFGRDEGLVSGRRFPIVLTYSDRGADQIAFDEVVALVDHCEDGDFSGWKPANEVWSSANLDKVVLRTWEVQVFNLAHPDAVSQGDFFLEHGLGYYSIAHVVNRALRKGAWGMVPPWLAQGLIDELDIAAYGTAWVGGDWWESQTPGWFRPGWSGFLPTGAKPPAPVRGPPAALATKVEKSGDLWAHRLNSPERHWEDLSIDRESAAPASFEFMAENESFLPRDRAYARCVWHLLLSLAPPSEERFFEMIDREMVTGPDGMPPVDALPAVFARSIGGIDEVERIEGMTMREVLAHIGRDDIAGRIEKLGAAGMLDVVDHRAQSKWMYSQPIETLDMDARYELWNAILETEYYKALVQWRIIGETLDTAADAALRASPAYPAKEKARAKVVTAFHKALAE